MLPLNVFRLVVLYWKEIAQQKYLWVYFNICFFFRHRKFIDKLFHLLSCKWRVSSGFQAIFLVEYGRDFQCSVRDWAESPP